MRFTISIAALILAAGRGSRAKMHHPKQYALLNGIPLIRRTVTQFLDYKTPEHEKIFPVIVVINPEDYELYTQALGDLDNKIIMVSGGNTRRESTLNGLLHLKNRHNAPDYVYIHDGARPFVNHALLDRMHAALTPQNGVVPLLPVAETLKQVNADGLIERTIARDNIYTAQTPQAFPFPAILAAHECAAAGKADFTDDSAVAEAYDLPVRFVAGDSDNIKITWKTDIAMANYFLQKKQTEKTLENKNSKNNSLPKFVPDIRTGNGYDVHRLVAGDSVVLCGIKIPCSQMLQGHSDADVGLHALTDALLATCGADDIGVHFPPSDMRWRGASSAIFVRRAAEIITEKGGHILNIDVTLILEQPKIAPHRAAMIKALQDMLHLPEERISVKATTNEMLGFIGREEGIAAIATANVFYGPHHKDIS